MPFLIYLIDLALEIEIYIKYIGLYIKVLLVVIFQSFLTFLTLLANR